jgi:hypothetical protein
LSINYFEAMRTTIRLPDDLLLRAKAKALRERRSLTSLIEEGLARVLDEPPVKPRGKVTLPVSPCKGGAQPGVDLTRNAALRDLMDGL